MIGTGGSSIYRDIIKKGFPPEYQILCFNCNLGKHLNGGTCPHKFISEEQIKKAYNKHDIKFPYFWRGRKLGISETLTLIDNILKGKDIGNGIYKPAKLENIRRKILFLYRKTQ